MFKRTTILLGAFIIVISMCSCKNKESKSRQNDMSLEESNSSTLDVYYDMPFTDLLDIKPEEGVMIRDSYVNNAETAQAIGDAVIKSIVGEEEFKELVGVFLAYDEENGLWLVNRNLGDNMLGGDYSCVIKQSNGEILKVIAGE